MATPIFAGLKREMFDEANPAPYAIGAERGSVGSIDSKDQWRQE